MSGYGSGKSGKSHDNWNGGHQVGHHGNWHASVKEDWFGNGWTDDGWAPGCDGGSKGGKSHGYCGRGSSKLQGGNRAAATSPTMAARVPSLMVAGDGDGNKKYLKAAMTRSNKSTYNMVKGGMSRSASTGLCQRLVARFAYSRGV